MAGVTEWWNNWGCCCGTGTDRECPCACYTFNDTPNDNVGSLHLTGTYPAYDTGKLGKAAKFTGTQYFEHGHHNCFVPQSTGINIWFWIYREQPSTGSGGTNQIEYIVTKGLFPDSTFNVSSGPNEGNFPGTWSVFIDPKLEDTGTTYDLSFAVAYENGFVHDYTETTTWESTAAWVFFFIWYEPTAGLNNLGRASIIRNGTTVVDESTVGIGVPGIPMRQTDNEKLYVGKHLGATESETIKIDNLGFCKDIGTKVQMTERAVALYNSGNGLACNASGK